MSLNQQAQEIMRIAEESGVQSNFFFLTTFKRYQVQLMPIMHEAETRKRTTHIAVSPKACALMQSRHANGRKL